MTLKELGAKMTPLSKGSCPETVRGEKKKTFMNEY